MSDRGIGTAPIDAAHLFRRIHTGVGFMRVANRSDASSEAVLLRGDLVSAYRKLRDKGAANGTKLTRQPCAYILEKQFSELGQGGRLAEVGARIAFEDSGYTVTATETESYFGSQGQRVTVVRENLLRLGRYSVTSADRTISRY